MLLRSANAFLRLSRQILVSDSDDDELEDDSNKVNNNLNLRNETTPEKKANGVNSALSSKTNSSTSKESRKTSARSLRSSQCPRNSAAINVINNETILPQRSHPTKNEKPFNTIQNSDDLNRNNGRTGCNKVNGFKKMSPLLDADDAASFASSSSGKSHKKRGCSEVDRLDDFPTNSRYSNNISHNGLFEEITTSTSTSTSPFSLKDACAKSSGSLQQLQSPTKRRKMSISDYIKTRSDINSTSFVDQLEQEEFELNNNETNNNDIFASEGENVNNNLQLTPQRPILINRDNNNMGSYDYAISSAQYTNNNSHLFTPDSGISLNNSTTPSTADHHDIELSTSTTAARNATYLTSSYERINCDVKNIEEHEAEEDEGVIVINTRQRSSNQFQQKVARVRRNYRKQFFDDTESD